MTTATATDAVGHHFELDGREFIAAIEEPRDGHIALPPILAVQDLEGGAAARYPLDHARVATLRRRVPELDKIVHGFTPSGPAAAPAPKAAELDYDKLAAAMKRQAATAAPAEGEAG